jgi:hypothetical protein
MKYSGTIAGELSGSLGGITASRNRGGQYLRSKVNPVNPNSTLQSAIRTITQDLANRWVNNLTTVQRQAWDLYAENVGASPPPGGLGINIGGIAAYQRANLPRLYADYVTSSALARIDAAPIIFDIGSFSPVLVVATGATNTVSVAFTAADDWANATGAAMLVYSSNPVNPSVNNYSGKYNLADIIAGDDILPPTSPAAIVARIPFAAGQRVFVQVRVAQADGRYSSPQRLTTVAV